MHSQTEARGFCHDEQALTPAPRMALDRQAEAKTI